MKKKYYLAGVLALIGGAIYLTRKSAKKSFLGLEKIFGSSSRGKENILFIGDSITADPKWSYPALIKKNIPYVNVDLNAKSGQTTGWMLKNLPAKLAAKKYSKVFIYGGVNDAMNDTVKPSTTVSNVQQMIDLARNNGAQVYVILGYEPSGFMDYKKMPLNQYMKKRELYIPMIEKYKGLQNAYSTQLINATIIPKVNLGNQTLDGIHPNGTGQRKIADKISMYL